MMLNRISFSSHARFACIRSLVLVIPLLVSVYGCGIPIISDPKCIRINPEAYSSKDIRDMFESAGWEVSARDSDGGCAPSYDVQILTYDAPLSGGYKVYIASSSIVKASKSTHPMTYMASGPTLSFTLNHVIGKLLKDLE